MVRSEICAAPETQEPAPAVSCGITDYARAYRFMLTARVIDEKLAGLYRAGKIFGGVFLGRGQEALSVALGISLRRGDAYAPLIRDGAGRLAFGESVIDGIRNYMGSPKGPMRARDGNVHRGRPSEGYLPMISHLGAMISVVAGMLMAEKIQGKTGMVGGTCIGDGGTSTGAFHEAVNLAAVEKLPIVIVIANNQYAYSTPTDRQFACKSLVDRALGYGIAGYAVDGTDLGDCLQTIRRVVGLARNGAGPQLVVGDCLRLCGHGEHDDAKYIAPGLRQSRVGRDCLSVAERFLVRQGTVSPAELREWKKEETHRVDQAIAVVRQEERPDPYRHDWCSLATRHLFEPRLPNRARKG